MGSNFLGLVDMGLLGSPTGLLGLPSLISHFILFIGYSFGCFSWPLSLFEVVADVGDEEEGLGAEPRGRSKVLTGAICGV